MMTTRRLADGWRLATDPDNRGRDERWQEGIRPEAQAAPVPGIIQQVFPGFHGVAWYWLEFDSGAGIGARERALLRFGAVDYLAEAWVNGRAVGGHEGGETPFDLDVTTAIRPGRNLLAVRVLNPTDQPIDGMALADIPHRNKVSEPGFRPGSSYNYGGILLPVELDVVPDVRIADVFARPRAATGAIDLTVRVRNDGADASAGSLSVSVAPARSGETLTQTSLIGRFPPGDSCHELRLAVPAPRPWSLDDPVLYRVTAALRTESAEHVFSIRCGFRDFRVTDGWFALNGKRLFLRSTHTGNHFPVGQVVPQTPDFMFRDLLYAKALGFNTVRFISGVAWPEQLDFCDEIGLMVYEENLAGWCLADSPRMKERFDRSTREMILRDRNHPSVALWGLLNETLDGPVFRHAVASLSLVRELDDTRLVLLGSGRWDCQPGIGSVSNPGSREWDHVWGIEAPGAGPVSRDWDPLHGGYFDRAGDAHAYPLAPLPRATHAFLRTVGRDTKPVFLSETGMGSLFNVVDEARGFRQAGARADVPDLAYIESMRSRLEADWAKWRMSDAYPAPEDMLRDSYRLHVRQRLLLFNLIRSNPRICGYNLTGMLDHALTGEGVWTFWREFKPGMPEALRDGWAPLRWCLFATPMHAYAGREIHLEAVLANEDVLPPGRYPAVFRLSGPEGVVWERREDVCIPRVSAGSPPLAVPVFSQRVKVRGPAGAYTFAASMEAAAPLGDRLKIHISRQDDLPRLRGTVLTWGLDASARRWLESRGLRCRPFTPGKSGEADTVLVGLPPERERTAAVWEDLTERVRRGGTAIALTPRAFAQGEDAVRWLPLKQTLSCKTFHDWLYHKECVARRHPVFSGLQAPGILDWDYYEDVISHQMFQGAEAPLEVMVAAFAVGYSAESGYDSGVMMGVYRLGRGRLFLNTLNVLDHLGRHPAADRLMANLVGYALAPRSAPRRPRGRVQRRG